jgi:hypothetical protein
MSVEIDDGTRHLGEPICAACGGGLEYDGGNPSPEDIVSCDNPKCGRIATYAEVAADCGAWYAEYMDFHMKRVALGATTAPAPAGWKPRGKYRFAMKIVGFAREEDFASCNPVRLNY